MSFNFKQKVIIKRIDPDKLYSEYIKKFDKNIPNKCCNFCNNEPKSGELNFGIPINLKMEDDTYIFEVCGQYCSLGCAYQDYKKFSEKITVHQNIKFVDAEPCFRMLSYLLFETSDIPKDPKLTCTINVNNVSFVFTNPYVVK